MHTMRTIRRAGALVALALAHPAAAHAQRVMKDAPLGDVRREPSLRRLFAADFRVGAALNPEQFHERDRQGVALVKWHFNAITPENVLKWEIVHPEPGRYDFAESDRYVAFGERHGMFIVGHTLVWHSQTPRWVFEDSAGKPLTRAALLARMRDHIHTVVGRYRGRVNGWDVVNEALNDDGTLRQSPWYRIIGEDYLAKAFQYAREADPKAELYYNDYSLARPDKREGAVRLVRSLQAAGVKVAGIGSQDHHKMFWPAPALVDSMFQAFRPLGVKVHITELDVDVLPQATRNMGADVANRADFQKTLDPYTAGLPDSVQQALAQRYREMFDVYVRNRDIVDRVTFWGVRDDDSWLNGWPIRGRTAYPLLFDRQGRAKPAFRAVVDVARTAPREATP
jgi:endo-1,4-beta-xylanase